MKNKILRLSTALALLVTGCQAHAFPPVLFNSTNGNVVLPTNFWAANSNALNQVISQLASNNATAIQGSNIVAGTINSNKLDAATRAMLGGGTSGGTSDYNALINKPVLGVHRLSQRQQLCEYECVGAVHECLGGVHQFLCHQYADAGAGPLRRVPVSFAERHRLCLVESGGHAARGHQWRCSGAIISESEQPV